ncbi:phage portal protein [Pseudomonas putida]|uniref:phage portal protein n=1 Tax=Pseudomonas putida TaxID=303 RepID=UPI00300F5057
MNLRELEAQAKALAPVLRGFVDKALAAFRASVTKDLDERDAGIRAEFESTIGAIALLDPAEIALEAAQHIPKPENGRDADPDLIRQAVADEVAKLPAPKDGASVTVEDVTPILVRAVKEAVDALPPPEPGKSVTIEDVRPLIAEEISKLPSPKDGTSVTLDDVTPMLQRAVKDAVEALPPAEPGKSVTVEDVRPLIVEEVAKLPLPKDGTSVTLDDVAPVLRQAVKEAVDALSPVEPGASVTPEDLRSLIAEEVARAVQALALPKDGEPGRDALQLEILPEIDREKSYVRGTYAKHLGGLWRSFERTSGMKGWECIVEGIDSAAVEQSGERGFELALVLSSGAEVRKKLDLPVMIYRGVFSPGEYLPGDTVTWAGSLWHCEDPTSDKPGEAGSKGWRLAVKRGRDGKDGTNGKDLIKGVSAS